MIPSTYPAGYSIIATTGYTGTHLHEAAIQSWLDCARWCRSRRRRDGVSSLTRGNRHCLRPSSARPTDGFLCQRSCLSILSHGTWTQFKYYLITSLYPRRRVAETWKRLAQLMDSYSRGWRRERGRGALCMHIMREGCERPRDATWE